MTARKPALEQAGVVVWNADTLVLLRADVLGYEHALGYAPPLIADASIDAVVTDPPYGLEFMGKAWDSFRTDDPGTRRWRGDAAGAQGSLDPTDGIEAVRNLPSYGGKRPTTSRCRACGKRDAFRNPHGCGDHADWVTELTNPHAAPPSMLAFGEWCRQWATEIYRVLKPGGHMLAFGGTRTWHRLAAAVEDAGFEVRDSLAWMYGSGFPKSMDVSKAIEATILNGNSGSRARRVTEQSGEGRSYTVSQTVNGIMNPAADVERREFAATTVEAAAWQGWGTALKPAFEPIVLARKPLSGTVAVTVLQHGTGALNVAACRIEHRDANDLRESTSKNQHARFGTKPGQNQVYGDYSQTEVKDYDGSAGRWPPNVLLDEDQAAELDKLSDLPSRFFYLAKAPTSERVTIDGVAHPTVKPLALMRWLVRLVTPPGGTVLEPFGGSGTTAEACLLEGFRCVLVEREPTYLPLIRQRLDRRTDPVAAVRAAYGDDGGLFDLLDAESSAL